MLLKGWRIKKLIAHRQKRGLEDSEDAKESYFADKKRSISTPRRLSWLSQNPYPEGSLLRRVNSSATMQTKPPPLTMDTAYSSISSLCSCECETKSSTNGCSLLKAGKARVDVLYLPPDSPAQSGDAKTWQLIFSEPVSHTSTSSTSIADMKVSSEIDTRLSTFDLLQALSIEPMDADKTPTQSIRHVEESEMDDLSADVDQLIRETDEAFRAVGTALADAKAATQGWYDTPEPPTIITRTPTIPRGVLKKSFRTSVPAVKSPLSRSVSVSKNKNKRTKMSSFSKKRKTNILSWALKSVPPPPSNTPSRWTLTDVTTNMVDVFSGKIFRTEVDEMLTPSRMLRLKQELRIENERRASIESFKSEATDGSTPTEPFHLEGLVGRIEMLRKKSPYPIPVLAPPALPKSKGSVPFEDKPETAMQIDDLQFPSPPQQLSASRQQQRNRSNSRVPQLPTIPEVSPLSISLNPIQKSLLPSNSKSKRKPKSSLSPPTPTHFRPQNFIDLPSTSFTLTSPLFRHGPIRLDRECFYALNRARKSDSSLTNEDEGEGEEETFDWTAFQMAILGTMDDEFDEDEDEVEWDEKVREDLFTFWSDLRFNNEDLGRMTKKEDLNLDNEVREIDIGLDDPRINLTHENLRSDNWRFNDQGQDYETMMQGLRISEQVVEAPVQYGHSTPSSPLVDLGGAASARNADGDVDVVIPMGFNLGHDLGIF